MQMTSAKKLGKRKAEPPPYTNKIIEDSKKKIKIEPGLDFDQTEADERSCNDEGLENDDRKIAACIRFLADVGNEPETKGAAIKVARHRLLSVLQRSSNDEVSCLTWLQQQDSLRGLDREALHEVAEIVQDAEVNEIVELLTRRCSSPIALRALRKHLKVKLKQLEQELQPQTHAEEEADGEDSSARQDIPHAASEREHAETRSAENTEPESKAKEEVRLPPCPSPGNLDAKNASYEPKAASSTHRRSEKLAAAIPSGPSSLKPTMKDHVQCTKEQRFMYVLLPLNTPEVPICDASEKEVTLACRAAFNTRAKLCSAQRLGDRMWYACFEKDKTSGQKPQLVNSVIFLRGMRVIANHLPALPCRIFVADVPRSTQASPHAILSSLAPELDARRCNGMTLLHQTFAGRSRFIAYFAESPNLLRFYVPVQGGKDYLIFKPYNETALCWCKMYHNGKQCSAGKKYEYRHGRGGLGIRT